MKEALRQSQGSRWLLAVLAAVTLALHSLVFFGSNLGEQDSARLLNDALLWEKGGIRRFEFSNYQYFTSPAYIWLTRGLLPLSRGLGIEIGSLLNGLNVALSAAVVVPLFNLFRCFLPASTALLSTAVLLFMPAFWQAGLYGFPHLPAMLFMVMALENLCATSDEHSTSVRSRVADVKTVAYLTAAILLKADIYMSMVAAPLMFFWRRCVSVNRAVRLAVVASLPVFISVAISSVLLQDEPNLVTFALQWNAQYEPEASRLISIGAVGHWLLSFGFLTLLVSLAGTIVAAYQGRIMASLVVFVWAFVPLLFWSTRPFDSSRHHFQSTVPAALGVGLALDGLPAGMWVRGATVLAMLGVNYFAFPASDSTAYPSGNLLGSAALIKNRVGSYEAYAREFADAEARCRVVIGTNTNPYMDRAVLSRASRIESASRQQRFAWDTVQYDLEIDGERIRAVSVVAPSENDAKRAARMYLEAGYRVYSYEYELPQRRVHPERQGLATRKLPACGAF